MKSQKKKMTKKQKQICSNWDRIEDNEPDISTERLINMTADYCRVDVCDVAEALIIRGEGIFIISE